jgi:vacuolar protein sorting-associated protein 18
LVIGTLNGRVIRWDVDTDEFDEVNVGSKSDDRIHRVFVDTTGNHCIVSCINNVSYYIHGSSNKSRSMSKLKGQVIESVAWNTNDASEKSTGNFLVGTRSGEIIQLSLDKDKGVKSYSRVYQINDGDEKTTPIVGLHIEEFPDTLNQVAGLSNSDDTAAAAAAKEPRFFVMAATAARRYQFVGGPTFDALFSKYTSDPPFVEVPANSTSSELCFHGETGKAAETCAWSTGFGIVYGDLVLGDQDSPGDKVVLVDEYLPYPGSQDRSPSSSDTNQIIPRSFMLTQFHMLLAFPSKLTAINMLSKDTVYDEILDERECGRLTGLTKDPFHNTVWMFSSSHVFEIEIDREDRNAWSIFLQKEEYEKALQYCTTPLQRDEVLFSQAEYYFRKGTYQKAALMYAQTDRSFEEIALKFVNIEHSTAALRAYLLHKLESLDAADMTQQVMICTWLTEIFLDRLNTLQADESSGLSSENATMGSTSASTSADGAGVGVGAGAGTGADGGGGAADGGADDDSESGTTADAAEKYDTVLHSFHDFLETYSDVFDRRTMFELISSHGRIDDLLFYAKLIKDYEWVIQYHLQQNDYDSALDILRDLPFPRRYEELYYRYTPVLMQYIPDDTVDMLLEVKKLQPAKLIPALMRCEEAFKNDFKHAQDNNYDEEDDLDENPAVRFLRYCILMNGCMDPAVHNYFISLLAKLPGEQDLLDFVELQRSQPVFDHKYALRLCHEQGKLRSCVAIYSIIGVFEDAVKLALQVSLDLAKTVIYENWDRIRASDRKHLWFLVTTHVIEKDKDVSMAMKILKEVEEHHRELLESDDSELLKIEDILPFFPDFVKIGSFKEEICATLEHYNNNIDELKEKMDEYTQSADDIREDISNLRDRSGFVTATQRCDICLQPVLTRQFYYFPCTHVFHTNCIANELYRYLKRNPRIADQLIGMRALAQGLLPQVSEDDSKAAAADNGADALVQMPTLSDLAQNPQLLDDIAASECLLCGNVMIHSVSEPFIDADEGTLLDTWRV